MISVSEAERIILSHAKLLSPEVVPLNLAHGRLLREDIKSDRDQPPFDKALMDGIAFHTDAYNKGIREFAIDRIVAAGDKPYSLKKLSSCVQIMTGAVVPAGTNVIIPVEQVFLDEDIAKLKDWTLVKPRQNIRFKGTDAKRGQLLIKSLCQLQTPHIGILASVGKTKVKVSPLPRIAIISTGNELIEIHKTPQTYQTRSSNSHALKSLIGSSGLAKAEIFHYPDDKKALLKGIGQNLKNFDILILSGGVSMGEFDFVPGVLKELKAHMIFHNVAQKPGKPMWFGKTKTGKAVFALPGNPVSTQMCAYRYVIPFLKKVAGFKLSPESVTLLQIPEVNSDLTSFIPVRIAHKNGINYAQPIATGGSGDFAALAASDGFIEYDREQKPLRTYFSWRV